MEIIRYIFIATLCLGLFYAVYLLIFRHETNFRQLRFYLLASMVLSLVLPLNSYRININLTRTINPEKKVEMVQDKANTNTTTATLSTRENSVKATEGQHLISWKEASEIIYFTAAGVLMIRLMLFLIILIAQYLRSEKVRLDNYP